MGFQWSGSAEAFMLSQLGQVVNFWKQGRPATFLLETQQNGGANLSIRFQLPKPHISVPPPTSHPNPTSLFPNGQAPRPNPTVPLIPGYQGHASPQTQGNHRQPQNLGGRDHSQSHHRHRPPSYQRRGYRRAVLHRARLTAPVLPPPLPNTLRAIAAAAVESQHRKPSVLESRKSPSPIPDREELRCGDSPHFPLQPDLDLSPIPDRSGGGQSSRNESYEEMKHGGAREEVVVPDSPLWSEEAGEPEFPGSTHEEEEDKEQNGNVMVLPSGE